MRKYITVVVGLLVLVGGYFISKAFITSKPERPNSKVEKPALTVFTQVVKNTMLPITVKATGALMAKERVELFAEVQGVFKASDRIFKPGVYYPKGAVLMHLEAGDQKASLQAQKSTLYNLIATSLPDLKIDFPESFSQWEKYAHEFDINVPLKQLPSPVSDKEKVFISSRNIYTTYYNIEALALRLEKYIIRAPFSGVLTATSITSGTLVRPGQMLGEFISAGTYEMEVAVGVSFMPFMKIGKEVEVKSLTGTPQIWKGKVLRINNKVDRASQTATVYLQVQGENLAEGMYLEATIDAKQEEEVFELDRTLLIDENKVFIVKDSVLTAKEVTPVHFKQKTALVKGLSNGDRILAKAIPGAYEGLKVTIYKD